MFCTQCGDVLVRRVLLADPRERLLCRNCAHVHYENPKVLVACLVTCEDRVLLCRRALEPAYGMWAPPGGYLENGETLEEAATREVWEEAGVTVSDLALRGVTTLISLQQVYVNFTATTREGDCRPGAESLDAAFFSPRDVPWSRLAFPPIAEDLEEFLHDRATLGRASRIACKP